MVLKRRGPTTGIHGAGDISYQPIPLSRDGLQGRMQAVDDSQCNLYTGSALLATVFVEEHRETVGGRANSDPIVFLIVIKYY